MSNEKLVISIVSFAAALAGVTQCSSTSIMWLRPEWLRSSLSFALLVTQLSQLKVISRVLFSGPRLNVMHVSESFLTLVGRISSVCRFHDLSDLLLTELEVRLPPKKFHHVVQQIYWSNTTCQCSLISSKLLGSKKLLYSNDIGWQWFVRTWGWTSYVGMMTSAGNKENRLGLSWIKHLIKNT